MLKQASIHAKYVNVKHIIAAIFLRSRRLKGFHVWKYFDVDMDVAETVIIKSPLEDSNVLGVGVAKRT